MSNYSSAFNTYQNKDKNGEVVWFQYQNSISNSESIVSLIQASDTICNRSKNSTPSYTQMLTPVSVPASTSTANLPMRQQQKQPLRIAQPPPNAGRTGNLEPLTKQQNSEPMQSRNFQNINYTTVFHTNASNNPTTIANLDDESKITPHINRSLQRHPLQVQHNGSASLSNIELSGPTLFPACATDFPDHSIPTYSSALPHFNSVPALGLKQPICHSKNNSNTNSLLRHQQRVPSSDLSALSHEELLNIARAQQRQIEMNRLELEERRRLISATIATSITNREAEMSDNGNSAVIQQVQALKAQISRDEIELANLGKIQQEARNLSVRNQQKKQELKQLEEAYAQHDAQLRMAVNRIDVLKKQMDLLYQRRAFAASAAIIQQRKINSDLERLAQEQQSASNQNKAQQMRLPFQSQPPQQQRPQASVEPFQHTDGSNNVTTTHAFPEKTSFNYKHINKDIPMQHCLDESQRFLARGKPDQVSLRADSLSAVKRRSWVQTNDESAYNNGNTSTDNIWRYLIEEQRKGRTHVSFADIMAARNGTSVNLGDKNFTRQENSAIEKQAPKTLPKPMSDVLLSNDNKSMTYENVNKNEQNDQSRINQNALSEKEHTFQQESGQESINMLEKEEEMKNESGSDDTSNTTTIEPDDENEENPITLENMKINENHNFIISEDTSEKYNNDEHDDEATIITNAIRTIQHESKENDKKDVKQSNFNLPDEEESKNEQKHLSVSCKFFAEETEMDENDDGFIEETQDYSVAGLEDIDSVTTDESSSTISSIDVPVFVENSFHIDNSLRIPPKGILRAPMNGSKTKKHVIFDQTVLFLDVAYDGDYDLLVELAAKIPDISVANGEGITALHNAICAGNHDIVKFLIDNHADVNALDLDGWSPLHCAASCNNIVMLKQLIENGACVFATTLSKAETASDLFEETIEEFESGADYIQLVENCLGTVNDKKVYAAFSYDAENDDELSFEEGDELCVIDRFDQLCEDNGSEDEIESVSEDDNSNNNGDESFWWLCEHTKNNVEKRRGLVPRNYMALYPKWNYRDRYSLNNGKTIELPSSLEGVRTIAQRRRRRRRQMLAEQQRDEQFAILQWSNITAAAAAAAAAAASVTNVVEMEKVSATINADHLDVNSVIVNQEDDDQLLQQSTNQNTKF